MANVADILKQTPAGTKLWSNIFGEATFMYVDKNDCINVKVDGTRLVFYKDGKYVIDTGECTLWPSEDHRAWDDEAYKILGIEKKPETPFNLQPFDKVLVRDYCDEEWRADFFSHIYDNQYYQCVGCQWKQCIPYNDETKHLLGTNQEAPEWVSCTLIQTHTTGNNGDGDDTAIIEKQHNKVLKQADAITRLREEQKKISDHLTELLRVVNTMVVPCICVRRRTR